MDSTLLGDFLFLLGALCAAALMVYGGWLCIPAEPPSKEPEEPRAKNSGLSVPTACMNLSNDLRHYNAEPDVSNEKELEERRARDPRARPDRARFPRAA